VNILKPRDSRINTKALSIRQYFLLFWLMAAFNGFHIVIFKALMDRGMLETRVQLVINILMGYVLLVTTLVLVIIGLVRYLSWNKPLRLLSEATQKVAQGDFSVRIAPLRKDGKKDYIEVMFEDFNTMAKELAGIETLKSDFIANVSHEIKTPLSVIQNYAAVLQNENLSIEQRREYAQTIIEATQRLSALTGNILKLNKLENQEIIPGAAPYDVSEQIRRCALAFEEQWERKNIAFDADLDELVISHDEALLEIVWNNLIANAVKFTPGGGAILLTAKAECGGEPELPSIAVTVKDSGCGMDRETQKHLFDKFYQGDTSHAPQGNGLGLALVKRAVELSRGTITVDSSPGTGSVFTVRLPRALNNR
jgi:signal transduction histidine kinase